MSSGTQGRVAGVNGNMVTVDFEGQVQMNEVAYVVVGDKRLKSEVIRIQGDQCDLQVFEMTRGIGIDDEAIIPVDYAVERKGASCYICCNCL